MKKLTKDQVINIATDFDELGFSATTLIPEEECDRTIKDIHNAFNELIKYKDIEEELGIDLITFIKILSADTLYKKSGDEICEIFSVKNMEAIFDKNCFVAHDGYHNCSMHDVYCYLHLKDYGKTWALTKEELEEE